MTRPIMLLSLPNSGTDWFCDLMLRQDPSLRYYREFFNPICNQKHGDVLERAFGSEMPGNLGNIAKPSSQLPCEEVFQETWARESYTFSKENFSQFRVDFHTQKFDCFVLIRSLDRSLPASRREQVTTWYDAMYSSLLRNYATIDDELKEVVDVTEREQTVAKRMVGAFVAYAYKLLKEAVRYRLPILEYSRLVELEDLERLQAHLAAVPSVRDPQALAGTILATRVRQPSRFGELNLDAFAARLVGRLPAFSDLICEYAQPRYLGRAITSEQPAPAVTIADPEPSSASHTGVAVRAVRDGRSDLRDLLAFECLRQLKKAQEAIAESNTQIGALRISTKALEDRILSLEQRTTGSEERASALEQEMQRSGARISELAVVDEQQARSLAELSGRSAYLEAEVAQIHASLRRIKLTHLPYILSLPFRRLLAVARAAIQNWSARRSRSGSSRPFGSVRRS